MPRAASLVMAAVLAAASSPASAQSREPLVFPGSFWVNTGYPSPLEPGNLLTTSSVEQGLTVAEEGPHSLTPYVALTITQDQQGLDWNNKSVTQLGLRYARSFRNGVVQAGAGYALERRFRSGFAVAQPVGFAGYWFGWNPGLRAASSRRLWSSLPGTSWASVGTHAPAEGQNVIATLYVQQGITMARFADVALIPFVEHALTLDSRGRPWNNRLMHGEGLKVRVPVGPALIEAAALYKHERRWLDDRSAGGWSGSINLWLGWKPSTLAKE